MSSQVSNYNPKAVKYILSFFQWTFFFSYMFAMYSFFLSENILDLIVAIAFLRFSISAYQLDSVYNRCLIYECWETEMKYLKFKKGLGRRKRRKQGIKLIDDSI